MEKGVGVEGIGLVIVSRDCTDGLNHEKNVLLSRNVEAWLTKLSSANGLHHPGIHASTQN